MENQAWKLEFTWIKAHAGNRGNDLLDKNAKEEATNTDIECYNRNPKITVER